MQDIFEDMDKVLAKFSNDIKEMFKDYHREEVKEEVKEENQKLKELLKECKPYITQAVSRNFYEDDVSLKDTHPFHTYTDSYYESFQPSTDEELAELGLCRKEIVDGLSGVIESQKQTADALFKKLDKAKECLLEDIKDLRHYQCMDNEEWNKTNAWLTALNGIARIEKVLKELVK